MGGQGAEAGQVVAVVGFVRERHRRHQPRQAHVQAVRAAERLRIEGGKGVQREGAFALGDEQVVGQ